MAALCPAAHRTGSSCTDQERERIQRKADRSSGRLLGMAAIRDYRDLILIENHRGFRRFCQTNRIKFRLNSWLISPIIEKDGKNAVCSGLRGDRYRTVPAGEYLIYLLGE